MKKLLSLALGLALLPLAARAADDPFAGWSDAQLKVKILQLQKENSDLKAKLAGGASTAAAAPAAKASAPLLLDDFEADAPKGAKSIWAGCDDNKLGTSLQPQPFAASKGGSKQSPGKCARISGSFGKNEAPWPWASLAIALNSPDISGYSAIRFNAKGDGKQYVVRMGRAAVKDFAHFAANFTAGKDWTPVTIKFDDFAQPNWGAQVPKAYNDVEKFEFSPTVNGATYDLSIDDVTLVP